MKRFNEIKPEVLSEIKHRLQDLCDSYEKVKDFIKTPSQDSCDEVESFLCDNHIDLRINSGVSRGVIIWKDLDYVVKIDFCYNLNDYCKREAWLYEMAVSRDVHYYFAGEWQLFTLYNTPIYIQEKVILDFDYMNSLYTDTANDTSGGCVYDEVMGKYAETLIDLFVCDENENDRLKDFIYEYDIKDLHLGNIGLTEGGDLCFADYCGYDEEKEY